MSLALILMIAASVLLLVLGFGAILWLCCKITHVPGGSYRRSMMAVLLALLLGVAAVLAELKFLDFTGWPFLAMLALQLLPAWIVLITAVAFVVRPSFGQSVLVGTLGMIFSVVLAIPLLIGLSFFFQGFIVPTGAMATTILGYHKSVTCPECGHTFPVNASTEGEPIPGIPPSVVTGCTCPNCRFDIRWETEETPRGAPRVIGGPPLNVGDRFLVSKFGAGAIQRHDLVVFDYPNQPKNNQGPIRYIKRLIGLPGETIGIYQGHLFVVDNLKYPELPASVSPEELRQPNSMHRDEHNEQLKRDAKAPLNDPQRKFQIIRKSPELMLSLRRLVHDNDHQARDLIGKLPPRWAAEKDDGRWKPDDPTAPRIFQHSAASGEISWIRYRHLLRPRREDGNATPKPELITDFFGYNSGMTQNPNWVSDLLLECKVNLQQLQGEFWLELARGTDRFQARFQLDSGTCSLVRLQANETKVLDSKPTRLKQPGEYRLRFANVDERLTVWVDNDLPFQDGVAYDPTLPLGPTSNDLQPAGIGVREGGATVANIQLWRGSYYTVDGPRPDILLPMNVLTDPQQNWQSNLPAKGMPARTSYVQPGHYFCLGDNSPESADSREWGTVPARMMLGPAVFIYYPFSRAGQIR